MIAVFGGIGGAIGRNLAPGLSTIGSGISGMFSALGGKISNAVGGMVSQVMPHINSLASGLKEKLGGALSHVGGVAKGLGKAFAVGAAAAAVAIGGLAKKSVEGFAEWEQLVGGVDTLFKKSSDTVQAYAANAYKTAGLREFASSQAALKNARQQTLSGNINNYQQQLNFNQQTKNRLETNLQELKNRKAEIEKQLPEASPVDRLRLQNELSTLEQRIASSDSAVISQNQQLLQSQSALNQAENQSRSQIAETNSTMSSQIIATEKRITELENSLVKAKQNLAHTTITAPVDGTVLLLATKTVGGVVNAGQQLAQVVPEKVPLYVDATLENQDVGFVKQGQRVVVKIATYPFQRYGYLVGEVETISPDAIEDEKKGLVYKAKIKLDSSQSSKQADLKLLPGMSVSAEITTGKRRIIEFFLDPLITHTEDSLKVR